MRWQKRVQALQMLPQAALPAQKHISVVPPEQACDMDNVFSNALNPRRAYSNEMLGNKYGCTYGRSFQPR